MSVKKILQNSAVQWILCFLVASYVKFLFISSKKTITGDKEALDLLNANEKLIVAFWHGRLLMVPFTCPKHRKVKVIISVHRDGELITKVMSFIKNVGFIRGSSRKKGVSAAMNAIKELEKKNIVGITPDGPKGPRMRVGGNVISIAQKTGAKITPLTYSCKRNKIFNSWDRFMLPMPFNHIYYEFGPLITVDKNANEEELKKAGTKLEKELNKITKKLDKICMVKNINPEKISKK